MAAERDIDDLPRNDANHTALTPLWFLERAALAHPARPSVVHGHVRYTWADTYRRCRRLASALARRSVGHGSTVRDAISVSPPFPPSSFSTRATASALVCSFRTLLPYMFYVLVQMCQHSVEVRNNLSINHDPVTN
jgi:acyl-CoA synthetase (AMP-forming)/AMP-acid ligase II